uniref:ERC protein 2-like n=1 Tax=Erigeron canadensis TaxID=72917 RepID=UPI001CB9BD66|nr:ERC protein 2-like [Erigeron canadensis]
MGTAMTCDENCFAFEMVHYPDDDPSLNNKIDGLCEIFNVNDDKHTGEEYAKNAPVLATEHKELEFPVMDVLKDGSKAHDKIEAAEMTCDNNDFEVERVTHPDDNSALNDTIIRRCEVADTTTEDATNNKLTGEEYAQNAALATEYKELEFPMTGALKKGSKVLDKVETITHSKDNSALNDTIIKGCELVDTTIKDATNNKAVILDQNDFDFEMVNHTEAEDDSTFNNTITSSYKLLDTTIEDAIDNKKSLASTIDLVISLMREVESKEKTAEQAKEDSARSGLDILAKVDELQQAHQHAKETNDTLARRVSAKKAILITDVKDLQSCVSGLLNEGGKLLGVLDEIRKALEMRLASAIKEKELADKAKLEKESLAQKSLSYEESQMIKVVEESERLTQEAEKISKLQEFLIDRRQVVDMLRKDISDKCLHVNSLKELLNQEVMQSGVDYFPLANYHPS